MLTGAIVAALVVAVGSVEGAPSHLFERDGEVAKVIELGKRQMDSPIGAGIILAIIIAGLIALVGGLTFVFLKGNKQRQDKCRKMFCPCLPAPKDDFTNAPVYNGYGELIDPSKAGTAPQWQVDQQAAGQMSAAEAIALMETQAKQGVVQAAVPGIEVPSVIALEQTATIPSGSQMAGTKIARDANAAVAAVEAEAKEAEKAVENTADEAVDAAKKV